MKITPLPACKIGDDMEIELLGKKSIPSSLSLGIVTPSALWAILPLRSLRVLAEQDSQLGFRLWPDLGRNPNCWIWLIFLSRLPGFASHLNS